MFETSKKQEAKRPSVHIKSIEEAAIDDIYTALMLRGTDEWTEVLVKEKASNFVATLLPLFTYDKAYPDYTYNPAVNFKQGNNDTVLTIPPGPNGPVGTVWIDLSEPTFGIHGTPEPSRVDKTHTHACVRLTNWDAQELTKLLAKDLPVDFL